VCCIVSLYTVREVKVSRLCEAQLSMLNARCSEFWKIHHNAIPIEKRRPSQLRSWSGAPYDLRNIAECRPSKRRSASCRTHLHANPTYLKLARHEEELSTSTRYPHRFARVEASAPAAMHAMAMHEGRMMSPACSPHEGQRQEVTKDKSVMAWHGGVRGAVIVGY
jgi:hypothetical protein